MEHGPPAPDIQQLIREGNPELLVHECQLIALPLLRRFFLHDIAHNRYHARGEEPFVRVVTTCTMSQLGQKSQVRMEAHGRSGRRPAPGPLDGDVWDEACKNILNSLA